MGVQINGSEGNVIATKGTYSGNFAIGGTLTYEDVTNIDSVGLVTARTGIEIGARPGVAASISVDGNMVVSGITTIGGSSNGGNEKLNVAGAIRSSSSSTNFSAGLEGPLVDYDIANDVSRFGHVSGASGSARDVVFLSGGSEKVRIKSDGNVGINSSAPTAKLEAYKSGTTGYIFRAMAGLSVGNRNYDLKPPSSDSLTEPFSWSTGNAHAFQVDGVETLRISSNNKVGISTVSPDARLHVLAGNEKGILIEDNSVSNNAPYLEIIGKRDDGNVHQSFSGQIFLSRNRTAQKISAGLKLGTIMFGGNHTNASKSNIAYPASIAGMSSGDFNSVTDMPTDLVFFTGSTGRTPSTSNVSSGEEAMRIASSGAVTKPLQPRFWAKSNSAQTLNTNNTNYIRDFNSEQFDTGGCYDGTNKFTAPVNGYYHFGWHVMVNASHADSFTYFFGAPLVSGVDIQQEVMMPRSGGANYASLTASHLLYLTAGQYVQIRLRQSGGTGNMEVRSDQGYFWGYLVN